MQSRFVIHRVPFLSAVAGAVLLLTGCSSTAERLSSRRFREKPFSTLFSSEDPMVVLTRDSSEGDDRLQAMRSLKEPLQRGGSQAEQDAIIKILSDTATSDPQGICRLTAIETLGRFQDPRIPGILVDSWKNAPISSAGGPSGTGVVQASFNPSLPGTRHAATYSLDMTCRIQGQILESLGKGKSSESLTLLCEVASKPVKRVEPKSDFDTPVYDADHYRFDIRLAAIHAMRHYTGDRTAAQTLLKALQDDRDTAVQNRCMESLTAITGQPHGNDPKAWLEWAKQG